MRNWKYINGAESVRIGNSEPTIDSSIAKEIRELAGKHWHSGIHDSRTLALTVAFELAKKYNFIRETKDDFVSKAQKVIEDFIKQTKTGNDTPEEYAKRPPKVVGGNSLPEELEKDVEKKDKEKVEDIEELKKTGNSAYDMTDRDYENEYKSLVQKRNNVQIGTKEYEEIQKRLNEIRKKLGRSPFGNKIGNASTGDFTNLINRALKVAKTKPEKSSRMNEIVSFLKSAHNLPTDRWQYHIDRLDKEISAFENSKVGNSASDDKFAYVMREFDEGKLKTPDGKVVTDPAQAKAIAYSESKKTENGLARARNAIKK